MKSTAWVVQERPTHGLPDSMLIMPSAWVTQETSNPWVSGIMLIVASTAWVIQWCTPNGSVKPYSWNWPYGLYKNVQPMGVRTTYMLQYNSNGKIIQVPYLRIFSCWLLCSCVHLSILCRYMGDFTFWISLSMSLSLRPNIRLSRT